MGHSICGYYFIFSIQTLISFDQLCIYAILCLQYLYYTFSPKYILNKILSIISVQIIPFHALFLQGYSLCNPAIDVDIENNAHVPYAFRMGLISDELFQVLLFQT